MFDLDNTLYPLESGLAGKMAARITEVVVETTGLPREAALALQKRYLVEEGLTLRGLMTHHGVDPHGYHARFHDVPLDCLEPNPALAEALARLKGRRLVFTNSDEIHAERVLKKLGLEGLFDGLFHIGSADFTPKPAPRAFAAMLEAFAIAPERAAFFDDVEANLAPAADLGMTTVFVGRGEGPAEPHIHYRTENLAEFLMAART